MILLYASVLLIPMTFSSMGGYQDFILNAYLWLLLGICSACQSLALSAQSSPDIAAAPMARRWVVSLAYRGDISIPGSKAWNRACHP